MANVPRRFSAKTCESLKHYVYLYIDPRSNQPFYVGKGRGNRCFSHLRARRVSRKNTIIEELRRLGREPRIELLKYDLSEQDALLVEATAIDLLQIANLTNEVRGFGSSVGSRGAVGDIATELDAKEVKIVHSALLINITKLYRHGMELYELYDATRSAWKLGENREKARYALSVYRGVVREVFRVERWVRGGTTMKVRDEDGRPRTRSGRWEFVGQVAEEAVRRKYINRSVRDYFKRGAQNPVQYVNC